MVGGTQTVDIAPGVQLEVTEFTDPENKIFDADYEKLIAMYTRYSVDSKDKHMIADAFNDTKEVFRVIAEASKQAIQPSAGVFQGMRAMTGFGMTKIRPGHIVPNAQGGAGTPTFDVALATLTKDEWYGLYHNGAIGAAYNTTPLYLRKELSVAILGMMEVGPNVMADEIEFEINGKPLPIYNMLESMRGTDMQFFRFPSVEYIKPAVQYRSQFKTNAVAGNMCLVPVGIAFVTSDFMRQTKVTQPSTTAP